MAKTLCDWSKRDLSKHADKLLELVDPPRFFCRKCARVANISKVLCKPSRLPKEKRGHASEFIGNAERSDVRN